MSADKCGYCDHRLRVDGQCPAGHFRTECIYCEKETWHRPSTIHNPDFPHGLGLVCLSCNGYWVHLPQEAKEDES